MNKNLLTQPMNLRQSRFMKITEVLSVLIFAWLVISFSSCSKEAPIEKTVNKEIPSITPRGFEDCHCEMRIDTVENSAAYWSLTDSDSTIFTGLGYRYRDLQGNYLLPPSAFRPIHGDLEQDPFLVRFFYRGVAPENLAISVTVRCIVPTPFGNAINEKHYRFVMYEGQDCVQNTPGTTCYYPIEFDCTYHPPTGGGPGEV